MRGGAARPTSIGGASRRGETWQRIRIYRQSGRGQAEGRGHTPLKRSYVAEAIIWEVDADVCPPTCPAYRAQSWIEKLHMFCASRVASQETHGRLKCRCTYHMQQAMNRSGHAAVTLEYEFSAGHGDKHFNLLNTSGQVGSCCQTMMTL